MEIRNTQYQEQQLQQIQRLNAQQILQVRMLEMPLAQIEQAVKDELCENPALERSYDEDQGYGNGIESNTDGDYNGNDGGENADESDSFSERENNVKMEAEQERSDRADALDEALDSMGSDDRNESMEGDYRTRSNNQFDADQEEMVYGESQSFYSNLTQQAADEDLTEREMQIMDYLIGSLDSDGLLRKPLIDISDELAIYHSLDCTESEIESVLEVLQSFDPAGIGARTLQECLLLQIKRMKPSELRRRMAIIVTRYFDEFTRKHWEKLSQHLGISTEQTNRVIEALRRLNPKPGASLGETMGRNTQQVTPDFIIDTAYDGTVTFQLNNGDIPVLQVSDDFMEQYNGFMANKSSLNKHQKEGLLYVRDKIERAKGYIEAINKRCTTMTKTMRAIIDIQHKFFVDGDETEIVPMTLRDVAERIGMDISTVSRVCNSKYADTRWGTFPLRHFFSEGYAVNGSEEEMSTRKIKIALREIISREDKRKPLSDQELCKYMEKEGYPIARRTIAKYREQMNIPIARLRKQL